MFKLGTYTPSLSVYTVYTVKKQGKLVSFKDETKDYWQGLIHKFKYDMRSNIYIYVKTKFTVF